jgi:hypothetical protein
MKLPSEESEEGEVDEPIESQTQSETSFKLLCTSENSQLVITSSFIRVYNLP